jgi:hypothetical protein
MFDYDGNYYNILTWTSGVPVKYLGGGINLLHNLLWLLYNPKINYKLLLNT